MGDLAAEMITAVQRPGPQLVYGYHADLDMLGHGHGPGSLPWRLQLRQIDGLAALVAEALPSDALLLVTADHGMVAVDRTFDADTHPDLRRNVAAVGGDGRARHVYARPGAAADVLATWRSVLGDAGWVVPGEQAIAEGWFGPLGPHVVDRIGDVVVAARGSAAVTRTVAEPVISKLPGQHGSLSAEEQLDPPPAPPPRLSPAAGRVSIFGTPCRDFLDGVGVRDRVAGHEKRDSASPESRLAVTETETRRQVGVMR